VLIKKAFDLAEIPHVYNLVTTRQSFYTALGDRLHAAVREHNKLPILHLSMHGNDDGVGLTNGDFIKWDELRLAITPILNDMQGGLLICMSSCSGGAGCKMAMHEDADHPFWALVGNSGEASWSDAAVAYITFYHLFFKEVSVYDAVNIMKIASGDNNFMVFDGVYIKNDWSSYISKKRFTGGLLSLSPKDLTSL